MTDSTAATDERAVTRLFGLTDAVFAIAMTLLVIDIKLPDLGKNPTSQTLVHALGELWPNYLSFLLSFYVIAGYWQRHHRQMRTITKCSATMISRTILLLLAISAMPFAASVLGEYGGDGGIGVTVYAGVNAVAVFAILRIQAEVRRTNPEADKRKVSVDLFCDLVGFVLAAIAAYSFNGYGVLSLGVAMVLTGYIGKAINRRQARSAPLPSASGQ